MKMMTFRRSALFVLGAALIVSTACRKPEKAIPEKGGGTTSATTTTAQATAPAEAPSSGIDVGTAMPAYEAKNLDGSKFDLAGHKDQVVLLNLWATWCGPCRYEIPELQRIREAYKARGLEVIGVSVDEGAAEDVRKFVAENKMQYPVALDPEGNLANMLQTSVLPTTILIGRDGRVVWKKVGAILEGDEELKSAIEKAL